MLRNRSRAVTTKQALMADHSSVSSPSQNHTKPVSPFLGSPRIFNGFFSKGPSSKPETISPTSVLDSNPFSTVPNKSFSGNKHSWEKLDPKGIGLALLDSLNDEYTDENFHQPKNNLVLFGSKPKIQIPQFPPSAFPPAESSRSPAEFGIKTQNSLFLTSLSPFGSQNSRTQTKDSPENVLVCLSAREMELSEDYTCVISHGPNPKITHIYDNCILESCCGVVVLSESKEGSLPEKSNSPSESFLSFCYTCKKNLEQGKDIYMYRGEKAFCSPDCRRREILFDEVENPAME